MKKNDVKNATRGTSEYHALMRSVAENTLRHYAGYKPKKLDPTSLSPDKFKFTVTHLRKYIDANKYSIIYQIAIKAEFAVCPDCIQSIRLFINEGYTYPKVFNIYASGISPCEICGNSSDEIPF